MTQHQPDPSTQTTSQLLREVLHLRELMDERDGRYAERAAAAKLAVDAALAAAKEAVVKAEAASERRFEGVNEFRQTLADQATTFITRNEALARADANADKIDKLEKRLDLQEGNRGGLRDGWGYLVGAVGFASTIIAIIYTLSR